IGHMRIDKFFGVLFLLCVSFGQSAFAQLEHLKFKHLDISDGLSHHEITAIYKDSQGFVWIGTAFGLNRFDGYSIKTFLYNAQDTTSLPGNWIARIFETPDGRLAVSTLSGMALYDPENERF